MKNSIFCLFLFISGTIIAQNRENIQITHGPYLCDMSSDGVSIVWTTNKPALSWVELAPDDETHFYGNERTKCFATFAGRKLANDTVHHVRINHLVPGTTYRYRVFSQEVTEWKTNDWVNYGQVASSNVYRKQPLKFTTFNPKADEINFIVINDIHGRSPYMKELFKDVDFSKIDFIVLNGDMSNWVESQEQICKDYIDSCVSIFASETPIVFNRGNHETRGVFADRLMRYFPSRTNNFYYTFNIGKACFMILDGGEDKPDSDIEYGGIADYDRYREEQAKWLEAFTQSDDFLNSSTRIVFLHIPPPVGNWHGNYHLNRTLMPVLNRSDIDIMFSGHTHRYSYHEKNDQVAFPILVNDNNSYLKCTIRDNKLSIEIKGVGQEKPEKQIPIRF